ncbi:PI-PLC X domain-containing protein 3-like isoform X2 [Anthonomus grandis grandis]|uniref:PI-PLC X domain-containing protein 3-like isoform X2 n=1 Tax=Anthonomus grandis grandis TaxID=2921223 RepID=UPI002166990C|nr:PI-PLC X domain-containing protein 3-like isoform X2 [Anthonomus grandis grandis]
MQLFLLSNVGYLVETRGRRSQSCITKQHAARSHNSFTSNISGGSIVSLDSPKILQNLEWIYCIRHIMANWTKNQNVAVKEQLKAGIRYFDLRVSAKSRENNLYFCHGMYSCKVEPVLNEISTFLETHSKEVVILDFQHFYGFTQQTHGKLMQMLLKTYGTKLLPYSDHMDHLSLDYMTSQFSYQVITVYRSDAARFGQPLFWPSASFPTPWANTIDHNALFNFLDDKIKDRKDNVGFITQIVLTPTLTDILFNSCTTLEQKLAIDFEDLRTGWISKQTPGRRGVNIVIGDFIDLSDNLFTKTVINLNLKLLRDLPKRMTSPIN